MSWSPKVAYCDPAQLDRIAAPAELFEPGEDYILCNGIKPHTPGNMADGQPCESCGFAVGEQVVRRRAVVDRDGSEVIPPRVGRVICLNCGRGSLDLWARYNGLAPDSYPNEAWLLEYPDEEQEGEKKKRRPKYQPGPLKGGRGSRKKGVAK